MNEPTEIPAHIIEWVRMQCLALPEVTVRVDGSERSTRSTAWSYDIRRRSFCLLVASEDAKGKRVVTIVLRVDPEERDMLLSVGRPFFASRAGLDRIEVELTEDTDWDGLRDLLIGSYRVLAPKKLSARLDCQWTSARTDRPGPQQ